MAPRGLSENEKKKRALEFFYETQGVYNMKELESLLSKQKGITSMAIKGIVQMLVVEDCVEQDKIGTGMMYWAFPSKAGQIRETKIKKKTEELETQKAKHEEAETGKRKALVGREETAERAAKKARLKELTSQEAELREKIAVLADNDPERAKALKDGCGVCQEAAQRWTDNLSTVYSRMVKDRGGDTTEEVWLDGLGLDKNLFEEPFSDAPK